MLVLTRKPGQSILIGDGVEVQVLSTAGGKVRIGVTAPREVPIFRNEVKGRIAEADPGADEGPEPSENGRVADHSPRASR